MLLLTLAASPEARPPPRSASVYAATLCEEQRAVRKPHEVTPAFAFVRGELEAREGYRNRLGLEILRQLTLQDPVFEEGGERSPFDHPARSPGRVGMRPRCREGKVLVRASVPALGRLIERTPRSGRAGVLIAIMQLRLGADAAPLEPVLVRCLSDDNLQAHAAYLLRQIGPALHPKVRAALAKIPDPTDIPPEQAPDRPLSRAAVAYGMKHMKPNVDACYARFHSPGMVMANVVIAPGGAVTSVTVTGKLAGTMTSACVEAAIKSATFPPSSEGLTIPYPFELK
jgi:hypothetical protein